MPYQAHADLRNGLVGWWKFDESSGNAIDSSSGGNTGTPTGTTIVSGCKRGGCRSFNGTSDYIGTTGTVNYNSSIITFSFWLYDTATASDTIAFESSSNYNNTDYTFIVLPINSQFPGGKSYISIHGTGAGTGYRVQSIARPSTSTWHHWAAVLDNSTVAGI